MGSITLASRKALPLPPWDTPSQRLSVEHSGCSGAARWPVWPSLYSLPEETAGLGSRPLTQSQHPQGGFPEPPSSSIGPGRGVTEVGSMKV